MRLVSAAGHNIRKATGKRDAGGEKGVSLCEILVVSRVVSNPLAFGDKCANVLQSRTRLKQRTCDEGRVRKAGREGTARVRYRRPAAESGLVFCGYSLAAVNLAAYIASFRISQPAKV